MKRVLLNTGVLVLALGVSVGCYETRTIKKIRAVEVLCSAGSHQGDRLFRRETQEVAAPRWKLGRVTDAQTYRLCDTCAARRRDHRERNIRRIRNSLEVRFGAADICCGWNDPGLSRVKQMHPGDRIFFHFLFKNNSGDPIPAGAIRAIVRPAGQLIAGYSDAWTGRVKQASPEGLEEVKKLSSTGISVDRILPYSSPYSPPRSILDCEVSGGAYTKPLPPLYGGQWLAINPTANPGQDITFTGYITIHGREFKVGTARVHLMFR